MSTPSLAPKLTDDVTVYLVLNDFGLGRAYAETACGSFQRHRGMVASDDIAEALLERDASESDLSESARTFVGGVLDTAT
jgi:hypothetical protein